MFDSLVEILINFLDNLLKVFIVVIVLGLFAFSVYSSVIFCCNPTWLWGILTVCSWAFSFAAFITILDFL
jgi:hypothetical protein